MAVAKSHRIFWTRFTVEGCSHFEPLKHTATERWVVFTEYRKCSKNIEMQLQLPFGQKHRQWLVLHIDMMKWNWISNNQEKNGVYKIFQFTLAWMATELSWSSRSTTKIMQSIAGYQQHTSSDRTSIAESQSGQPKTHFEALEVN